MSVCVCGVCVGVCERVGVWCVWGKVSVCVGCVSVYECV